MSLCAHSTDYLSEELVVADASILVDVEDTKEEVRLLWSDLDAVVLDGFHKLLIVNEAVVVIIDDLEYSFQIEDSSGTSLSHSLSEFL